MDPIEFEMLVGDFLTQRGMSVEATRRTGDGGIDVRAYSDEPLRGGKFIVQCKRYNQNVGEPELRDLYGALTHERASKGILVTTGGFTRPAKEFAHDKPLELIDGDGLVGLMQGEGVIAIGNRSWARWEEYLKLCEKERNRLQEKLGRQLEGKESLEASRTAMRRSHQHEWQSYLRRKYRKKAKTEGSEAEYRAIWDRVMECFAQQFGRNVNIANRNDFLRYQSIVDNMFDGILGSG